MSPRASHAAVGARLPWPGTDGVPEIAPKEIAPRQCVAYLCGDCGHSSAFVFAAEAEVPVTQDCRRCWRPARLEGAPQDAEAPAPKTAPGRHKRTPAEDTTPFGQLMKNVVQRKPGYADEALAEAMVRARQARGLAR